MLTSWLHLLALTIYLGSVIGLWLMLIPSVHGIEPLQPRLDLLARALRLFSPVQVGALGVVVFTGALGITELKAAHRGLFAQAVGGTLALKLLLAFFLIVLSTYQAMGIAHRFVKRHEGGERLSLPEIEAVIGRLRSTSLAIVLLAAPTIWLGLRL
jgi:uncharacterized membrane protein